MGDVAQDKLPAWFKHLREIQEELSSVSLGELEDSCQEVMRECELDTTLDHRIRIKMHASFAVASATPRFKLRRALRSFFEDIPPKLHACKSCGHQRLVIGPLDFRERLLCGTSQMFYPGRTCQDPDDEPLEWLFRGNSPSTPDNVQRRTSNELDIFATVAEAVRLEGSGREKPPNEDLGVRRDEKIRGKRSARRRSSGQIPGFPVGTDVDMQEGGQKRSIATISTLDHASTLQPVTPTRENTDSIYPASRMPSETTDERTPSKSSRLGPMDIHPRLQTVLSSSIFKPTPGGIMDQPPLPGALGRAISDPQVLQRELARGIPPFIESIDFASVKAESSPVQALYILPEEPPPETSSRQTEIGSSMDPSAIQPITPTECLPDTSGNPSLEIAAVQPPCNRAKRKLFCKAHVASLEVQKGHREEEPARLATAAAVLRAGVESSSYCPGRPLSRAISDPRKLQQNWQNPAESLTSALQSNIPARGNLVEWTATVRFTGTSKPLDLFTLVGALPVYVASSLPEVIPLNGIRSRDAIRMDTVIDKPLLLRLGKVSEAQRHAVEQMERSKIAAFAQFPGFDLVLVPHMNSRELLHVIGLRMERTAQPQISSLASHSDTPMLSRTVSAFPALGEEYGLYDAERLGCSVGCSSLLKSGRGNLERIQE